MNEERSLGGALESGFGGGVLLGAKLYIVSESSGIKFESSEVAEVSGEFVVALGRGVVCLLGDGIPKVGRVEALEHQNVMRWKIAVESAVLWVSW